MRPTTRISTAGRTRLVIAGLAAAGLLASVISAAAPASAASLGLVGSTTALSATVASDNSTVTLTATVKLLNLPVGLGVTPSGTVTFSDDAGDSLGSATVSCLLKACTVSKTVSTDELSDSVDYLSATFVDKLLLKPSTGIAAFGFNRCTGDPEECGSGNAGNSTTDVSVYADSGDTASVTLGGAALPCSLGAGDVINSTGAGPAGVKDLSIAYLGAAGDDYSNETNTILGSDGAPSGVDGYLCVVAPYDFIGYSPGTTDFTKNGSDYNFFGLAPQISGGTYNGDYVGLLAHCGYSFESYTVDPTVGPCTDDAYDNPDGGGSFNFDVEAPSSDPHFGG